MNVAALAAGMLRDLFCVKLAHGLRLTNQGERALLNNGSRLFMLLGTPPRIASLHTQSTAQGHD